MHENVQPHCTLGKYNITTWSNTRRTPEHLLVERQFSKSINGVNTDIENYPP